MIAEGVRVERSDLAPKGLATLTIIGAKPVPKNEINSCFIKHSGYVSDPSKQVSFAVGDDGNLWIRSNDNIWKKVATE
jgi:hypothetical protein